MRNSSTINRYRLQKAAGPTHKKQSYALFRTTLLVGSFIILAAPEGFIEKVPDWAGVWTGFFLILGMTVWSFKCARQQGENPWLDATYPFSFFYLIFFGIGLLSMFYWNTISQTHPSIFVFNIRYYKLFSYRWVEISRLVVIGGAGLLLGTLIPALRIVRVFPVIRWNFSNDIFFYRSLFFIPVLLITYTLLPYIYNFIPLPFIFIIKVIGGTGLVVIIISIYNVFKFPQRRKKWFLLFVLYASFMGFRGLILGMRGDMLVPWIIGLLGYLMYKGEVPWKKVSCIVLLFLFVVLPWTTYIKHSSISDSITGRIINGSERFRDSDIMENFSIGLESSIGRFAGPESVAYCENWVPGLFPYQKGKVLYITLASMVPRMLWPDKPNTSGLLNWYSKESGFIGKEDYTTSAVFNAIGLYYLELGVIGIFFFCILHGWMIRLVHDFLIEHCMYIVGVPIYLLLILQPQDLSHCVVWISSVLRTVVLFVIVLYFLSNKKS